MLHPYLYTSDADLLAPLEVGFIELVNYAWVVEQQFGQYMHPVEQGIYKVGDVFPLISINNNDTHIQVRLNDVLQTQRMTLLCDIEKAEGDVVSGSGELLITSYVVRNKTKYLRYEPTVPSRAIIFLKAFIEYKLAEISPWAGTGGFVNRMERLILPEHMELIDEGYIEKCVIGIMEQVYHFIRNDTWNIYTVKHHGTGLRIEKAMDYRAFEWTKQQREIANASKQNEPWNDGS